MDDAISKNRRRSIHVLRVAVATLLIVHGVARLSLGIVDDFGTFLGARGFPLGGVIAWIITVVEILGGVTMAAGRLVILIAAWFALQLVMGMVLVHGPEGWFVVGAGRNGVEYSVLLIVCLAVIAVWHWEGARLSTGDKGDA